jgi:hypothetical protein
MVRRDRKRSCWTSLSSLLRTRRLRRPANLGLRISSFGKQGKSLIECRPKQLPRCRILASLLQRSKRTTSKGVDYLRPSPNTARATGIYLWHASPATRTASSSSREPSTCLSSRPSSGDRSTATALFKPSTRTPGRDRLALPRASSPRAPGLGTLPVKAHREQPARPLLPDHRRRQKQLASDHDRWQQVVGAIAAIMQTKP